MLFFFFIEHKTDYGKVYIVIKFRDICIFLRQILENHILGKEMLEIASTEGYKKIIRTERNVRNRFMCVNSVSIPVVAYLRYDHLDYS